MQGTRGIVPLSLYATILRFERRLLPPGNSKPAFVVGSAIDNGGVCHHLYIYICICMHACSALVDQPQGAWYRVSKVWPIADTFK